MKFICLVFLLTAVSLFGQSMLKEEVVVTYVYNFGTDVKWPNEAGFKSFNIYLLGDDRKLKNSFKALALNKKLNGVKISFKQVNEINDIRHAQLVYIADDKHGDFPKLFEKMEGQPVLLVTNNYANKRLVMINLIKKKDRMSFEINKANILNNLLETKP